MDPGFYVVASLSCRFGCPNLELFGRITDIRTAYFAALFHRNRELEKPALETTCDGGASRGFP